MEVLKDCVMEPPETPAPSTSPEAPRGSEQVAAWEGLGNPLVTLALLPKLMGTGPLQILGCPGGHAP